MNQIMPLLSLYSEIIACFVAASVLSLVVGWFMHKSRAQKLLHSTNESWEQRYRALEEISRVDAENLEEQLQNLATEARGLQADKKLLTESIRKNESSIQRSRAEAIELNRQHAETQERLQRIIQQKDREIMELGTRFNQSRSTNLRNGTTSATHRSRDAADNNELTCADTVAIDSIEMLDATLQIPAEEMLGGRPQPDNWKPSHEESQDSSLESDGSEALEMEEATVVLDEEALAFARRSSTKRRVN